IPRKNGIPVLHYTALPARRCFPGRVKFVNPPHRTAIDLHELATMRDRPALDLFLISWLVLFLELACIRWFPSHVLYLTFFTNTVLLACFVGMSIGCLVARGPNRLLRLTPYLLAVAVAAGLLIDHFSDHLAGIFA